MPEPLASWLATWLVHGTLLLGAAWLVTSLLRDRAAALQEALWRAALFGGLVTATLAVALGGPGWGMRVAVPALSAAADDVPHVPSVPASPPPAGELASALAPAPDAGGADAPAQAAPVAAPPATPWLPYALGIWLAGLALLGVRHLRARRRLRRRLAGRRELTGGPLPGLLAELAPPALWRRGLRLTQVERLGSPLALGWLRPEIVVPARAGRELTRAQQATLLAHEVAHHVRRDPLWSALARATAGLLFFQPLHVVAVRRLRALGELQADDWAARRCGDGRALAECLAVVAGWRVDGPRLAASAMASHGTLLESRVARLLAPRPGRRALAWTALLPLLAVTWLAPVVGPAAPPAEAASTGPPAEDAPAAGPRAALDAEIAALTAELRTLLDLLGRLEDPPPELTAGVRRLAARLPELTARRDALQRPALETDR